MGLAEPPKGAGSEAWAGTAGQARRRPWRAAAQAGPRAGRSGTRGPSGFAGTRRGGGEDGPREAGKPGAGGGERRGTHLQQHGQQEAQVHLVDAHLPHRLERLFHLHGWPGPAAPARPR